MGSGASRSFERDVRPSRGGGGAPSPQAAESVGNNAETCLALAIERASAASEWGIVAQRATASQARRVAVAEVLSRDGGRARRRGSR
jgi:hypothetical protein